MVVLMPACNRPSWQKGKTQMHALEKKFYSPHEVSELTGLSINTIRNLMKSGEIPFTNLGRRNLIPIKELEALLDTSKDSSVA